MTIGQRISNLIDRQQITIRCELSKLFRKNNQSLKDNIAATLAKSGIDTGLNNETHKRTGMSKVNEDMNKLLEDVSKFEFNISFENALISAQIDLEEEFLTLDEAHKVSKHYCEDLSKEKLLSLLKEGENNIEIHRSFCDSAEIFKVEDVKMKFREAFGS